jgi:hypothetical protein
MFEADAACWIDAAPAFIKHPVLSIYERFLLIYGVAGKTGTSN